MVLPLVAGLAGVAGGTLLGGGLVGKKEYNTINQAPFNTYAPVMTYAPQTSIAYTSGAKIINSPLASASERIGFTSTNEPYTNSMPNSTTSFNPNAYIPILLIAGGVIVLANVTKKK